MYVFRNNATINTFSIQLIDSMKFSSNESVLDVFKNDQSVTKIPLTSIDSMQFSDNSLPQVELVKTVYNYTTSRTICTVNIASNGGCALTERGICWSTRKSPTTLDRKSSGGVATGQFTIQSGVLAVDSAYYIRAYAKNCIGTTYSNEMVVKPTTGNVTFTLDIDKTVYPNEYRLIKKQWIVLATITTGTPPSKVIFMCTIMQEFPQHRLHITDLLVSDQAPAICGWVRPCTK